MSATDPDFSAENLSINGNESWFNNDVRIFEDLYVYGNLYYNFEGTDSLDLDQLNVTGIATFNDVDINGVLNALDLNVRNIFSTGIATFTEANVILPEIDNLQVGILTVTESFQFINSGNEYFTLHGTGSRAGRVGIGSTLPDQKLDVGGSIHIDQNIFDSDNQSGNPGNYLGRDEGGIRWVQAPPNAIADGFFAKNEGVNIGISSFTTINLIGNRSGGDLVFGTVNAGDDKVLDVDIRSRWVENSSGIHTTSFVGIGSETPITLLDVVGPSVIANLRSTNNNYVLQMQGNNATNKVFFGTTNANDFLLANENGGAGLEERLRITSDGRVGIGTDNPQQKLDVIGGNIRVGKSSNGQFIGENNSGEQKIKLDTDGVSFLDGGNVGIGTINPTGTDALTSNNTTLAVGIVTTNSIFVDNLDVLEHLNTENLIVTGFGTGTISTSVIAGFAATSGISTFSTTAGFALTAGISTFSTTAGFALTAGISTFATTAGFALTAGISTNTNKIDVDSTNVDTSHHITFIDSSSTSIFHKLKIDNDEGLLFNPSKNLLTVGQVSVTGILTVGGATTIYNTTQSNDENTGALVVHGGVGIKKNLNVKENTKIQGTLELDGPLKDINDTIANPGAGKTDYRLSSVGTGVSWRPSGVETKNILYVTKDGSDANSGLLEGDAKATIGGAAEVAQDGDTIYVRPGVYFEDNPVGLRTDVSISGQDLRLVTVVPKNVNDDIFHVRRGCLVENLNFAAENFGVSHVGCGCLAFPPIQSDINSGAATIAQSGYVGPGPANEGPSGRWRSPYARNCTNFITGSIGLKIDGRYADASYSGTNNLGQDLRSMVCDSFTQYNEAGIGVSVTNKAYAQLVSIFTINSRIGIFAGSGGQCDLTNSNSSFGDFGLFADGTSDAEFTGSTTGAATAESDVFSFKNVKDSNNTVRKPFDGQSLFFKINLADYPEVTGYSGIVNKPMKTLREIKIVNGGNPGDYSAATPPNVLVTAPAGPEAILAELSANVSAAGTITSVDVISNGRNFLPTQPIEVTFSGTGGAVGLAVTDPILFTIDQATEPTSAGLTTVTFNEFVPYSVGDNVDVEFLRISRIITSSHSFEYVGAGTDINRANPFQGGEPIPENEIVAINGGQIPFTSTDQKGNFRIGEGLTIDQTTSTISGRDFNRAIQANLTPLILALGG